VGNLKALEAIASFGFTTDNVENLIHQLCALSVVTLGPVVPSTRLTEDKVIGAEKLAKRTCTDSIHSTRLKINQDGTRNIFVAMGLVYVSLCRYIKSTFMDTSLKYTFIRSS